MLPAISRFDGIASIAHAPIGLPGCLLWLFMRQFKMGLTSPTAGRSDARVRFITTRADWSY